MAKYIKLNSYKELKEKTFTAVSKLNSKPKNYFTLNELISWIDENENIEKETSTYIFEKNDFSDFWELFYSIQTFYIQSKKYEEINKCLIEFQKINTEKEILIFLIENENLICSFSLSNFIITEDNYIKINKNFNIFINSKEVQFLLEFEKKIVKKYKENLKKYYSKNLSIENKKIIHHLSYHVK